MEGEPCSPEEAGVENVKLPQTEAIMEAIIRSTKPLPIGPADDPAWSLCQSAARIVQRVSDRLVPFFYIRWVTFLALVVSLTARVVLLESHFFTTYLLAIYILNQVFLFLSPATDDDDLPVVGNSGEYRPFVRALSEFKLWCKGSLATLGALVATLFQGLDVLVDGWELALYFVLLFAYTMKQHIKHMIKHRYVPWSRSKKAAPKKEKQEAYDV